MRKLQIFERALIVKHEDQLPPPLSFAPANFALTQSFFTQNTFMYVNAADQLSDAASLLLAMTNSDRTPNCIFTAGASPPPLPNSTFKASRKGRSPNNMWETAGDQALLEAIKAAPTKSTGAMNWSEVEKLVPDRTGKQCR